MDSRQYEWADVTCILATGDEVGVDYIKYEEEVEVEERYAKGRYPHSLQRGNISYKGEVGMTQGALERLIAIGGGSVLNIISDILFAYGNPANGDVMITDRMVHCLFTGSAKEMSQGDKSMKVKLPFKSLRLLQQVK
jgi:hypothetical protein